MKKVNKKNIIYSLTILSMASILLSGQVGFCQDEGVLIAKGQGLITFTGYGPLTINGEGTLVVNKNCSVTLPETSKGIAEVEQYIRKNAGVVYANISGSVQIDGKDIEVSFAGANIGLRVVGNGTVVLQGYGIYIYSAGSAGRWTAEGNPVSVQTLDTKQ